MTKNIRKINKIRKEKRIKFNYDKKKEKIIKKIRMKEIIVNNKINIIYVKINFNFIFNFNFNFNFNFIFKS
jgi:uncharacterized protein YaiL (DUF2058 family)